MTAVSVDEFMQNVIKDSQKEVSKNTTKTCDKPYKQSDEFIDGNLVYKEISNGGQFILFFGAIWCRHTKAAKPFFIQLQDELRKTGSGLPYVFQVECGKEPVCQQFGVGSTPTIRYYNGSLTNYVEHKKWDNYDDYKEFIYKYWKKQDNVC